MTQEERIRTELLKCERNARVTNFSLCMVQKTPFFFIRWSLKLEKKPTRMKRLFRQEKSKVSHQERVREQKDMELFSG